MMRKLLLAGAIAGAAAWFPSWFENNQDVFVRMSEDGQQVEPVRSAPRVIQTVRVAAPEESLAGRSARIERDQRGHFTSRFRLNGRDVDAVVDTGATVVAINMTTARRIGLELGPDDFAQEVETANGRTKAAFARLASLQIGRVYVENVDAVVLDDRALNSTLIGMSLLNRLRTYKVENGALVMEQ
jgi:aspartyl protease family protein